MNYLENPYDPEYMKPTREHFTLNEIQEAYEADNKLFQGLLSTPLLLGGALTWLILATVSLWLSLVYRPLFYVCWACIGLATVMILVWFVFHALPVTIKFLKPFAVKVIDFVCKPVTN